MNIEDASANYSRGNSLNFRYPTEKDTAILIRTADGDSRRVEQQCSHLTCPVYVSRNPTGSSARVTKADSMSRRATSSTVRRRGRWTRSTSRSVRRGLGDRNSRGGGGHERASTQFKIGRSASPRLQRQVSQSDHAGRTPYSGSRTNGRLAGATRSARDDQHRTAMDPIGHRRSSACATLRQALPALGSACPESVPGEYRYRYFVVEAGAEAPGEGKTVVSRTLRLASLREHRAATKIFTQRREDSKFKST